MELTVPDGAITETVLSPLLVTKAVPAFGRRLPATAISPGEEPTEIG